jgi:hypothetical protein
LTSVDDSITSDLYLVFGELEAFAEDRNAVVKCREILVLFWWACLEKTDTNSGGFDVV